MALIQETVVINMRASLGEAIGTAEFDHSPSGVLGKYPGKSIKKIPKSPANDVVVNLSTLFPGISTGVLIAIREADGLDGLTWSTGTEAADISLPANGAIMLQTSGELPTFYFTNTNEEEDINIEIVVIGN